MRRDVLIILAITTLVVTSVAIFGPAMTDISTTESTRANSIPIRTPEPVWQVKPTRPEPSKSVRMTGKAVDSVTGQNLKVGITLQDELGRNYIPTTDRSGDEGFDMEFRPDFEPQWAKIQVVYAPENYAVSLVPASAKDGRIDLGVVQFVPPPRVWFWRDAEHRIPCGQIYTYRIDSDTGAVGSEGRTWGRDPNGLYLRSGRWLVACRNADAFDFQEFEVVPGPNHVVVPARAIIADSLKIVARTPSGIHPPWLEWGVAQAGPYGIELYPASGSLSEGESPECRLVAGTYRVRVKPYYDNEWTTREFVLNEGDKLGPLEFEVADAPCIRVRVTRSGIPVVGHRIGLEEGDFERINARMLPTNERGEAYFGGLREWHYYLLGLGHWYHTPCATAEAGKVVDLVVDLDQHTGAVVRGKLEFEPRHADEVPRVVEVVSLENNSRASVRLRGGKFELRDVPLGKYEFVVRPNSVRAGVRRYPFVVNQAEHDFKFEFTVRTLTATAPDWVDSASGFETYYLQETAEHWVGQVFSGPPLHYDALPPGKYTLCIRQHRKIVAWGTADLTESDCPDVFWHELVSLDRWPADAPRPPFSE